MEKVKLSREEATDEKLTVAAKHKYKLLPTGKPHISFSEVSCWVNCSYAHKLIHVQHVDVQVPSPFLVFGSVQHKCCENLLKHGDPKIDIAIKKLEEAWHEHPEFEQIFSLVNAKRALIEVTPELKPFLDERFPGWEWVSSEELLYEAVEGTEHAFKGFIDIVIRIKQKNGKYTYYIMDFKTTTFGWRREKRDDKVLQSQLIYYKNFYAKKHNIDLKDIRAGFLLLKRGAKVGQKIELVLVSIGDITRGRALKVINNMLSSVSKGIALKNKSETSCKYCVFKNTPHCP